MKVAIISASGIGDGLLMAIAGHHFQTLRWECATYHELFAELSPLFPNQTWCPFPPHPSFSSHFSKFDLIVVQNDHSLLSSSFMDLRKEGLNVRFFFPKRSPWQADGDFLFNPSISMAENIANSLSSITHSYCSKENGIHCVGRYRHFSKRVVIHPTSKSEKKNWRKSHFLQLAHVLKDMGFEITFALSSKERDSWNFVEKEGFNLPLFSSLKETAHFLFESGYLIGNDSALGHLASNLNIPTLTIAASRSQIKLWRPDWSRGVIVTPSLPLPNFKGMRFRDRFWPFFVPVAKVQKAFQELVL